MLAFCRNPLALVALCLLTLGLAAPSFADEAAEVAAGRELFTREWLPGDARSHGGDGLGPVFNDTSCVACHNQGGVGGGGPASKNAQIVSAFSSLTPDFSGPPSVVGVLISLFGSRKAATEVPKPAPEDKQAKVKEQFERLAKIHPGLRKARSVVLHRFSTEPSYAEFRGKLTGQEQLAMFDPSSRLEVFGGDRLGDRKGLAKLTASQRAELNALQAEAQFAGFQAFTGGAQLDGFTLLVSERNATALFGSGKIDRIPDEVLEATAAKKYEEYPEVTGRVARLKDGRIGRFGWKAQKARLNDFVLTACAVELGLDVPGEPQSGIPNKPEYRPAGLDLNQAQCDSLIAFVGHLPAPKERIPANDSERDYLQRGRELFEATGCAACHTPELGEVTGIYSDLLLHDMGVELSDSGSYSGFAPNSTEEEELDQPLPSLVMPTQKVEPVDESKLIGATRQEWRTPPLWGVRDSGPYLHDGRAATIEQAIALHGGEGAAAAHKFIKLTPPERLQLTLFLRSLVAPE